MAKPKDSSKPAGKKPVFSDADLAAFTAALEDGDETDSAPAEEPAEERKIPVQEESSIAKRRGRPATTDTAAAIDAVLKDHPAEEMQHMTKSPRRLPWGWIIGVVALLAVVSLAGFFFFNRPKKFSNTNVQLHFQPITSATSGSTLTLTVEYQNLEPVDLTAAELTIEYPDGFTYASSQPTVTNDFHNAFTLGTIKSGQAGQATVTGTIIGAIDETRGFSATLTYRPANFNSEFQQHADLQVKITASILGLQLTGPTQLAPGATGSWVASYTNTSDHDLPNVRINATYPDGLTVSSVKPAADERSAVWTLATVKKGATGKITINGTVNGNVGDTLPLKISVGLLSATNTVDLQDEQSLLIVLVRTGVTTTVAVNGSTSPVVIKPGDTINYLVRVTNSSDVELTNATVKVTLGGVALDLSTLANDSQATVTDTILTWTTKELAALASLKPNQAVTLSFAVNAKSTLTIASDVDRNPTVTATIDVTAPSLAANTNSSQQPSTVVVTKVATVLGLASEARYYDAPGVALGSGPLPPVVGKTTTYRVVWTITNSTSDATSLTVSGRLPNNVLWTGQNLSRDAGDLVFDPNTRMVSWTLNTVPAGTGGRQPALTAHFDVALTPTADQVGSSPILVETPTAAATDSFTSQALSSPTPTLTTDLPNDTKATGQGVVLAQ